MVDRVMRISEHGGGLLDADTVISPASGRVALCAVGAGQAAARALAEDRFDHVMCLVRPPGHHATPSRSMGFCLFNNVALAAEALLAHPQIARVGIVDFDVHHGNGTQDVFYERGDVFFFSIHQYPHYPGTGPAHENGNGEGEGKNLNVPLPGGVSKSLWFDHFRHGLDALSAFEPDAILVSAGFDGHRLDPLGHFPLDEDGYFKIGGMISELAGHRRVVSFLEGGYNLEVLGRSVASYLRGFS
jgi:acetoin utilization deacetylase AcuC-like enzyme